MTLHGGTWAEIPAPPWMPYVQADVPTGMVAPFNGPGQPHLLLDGTILWDAGRAWYRLHPDQDGDYAGGHWTRCANRPTDRNYYASALLHDGRVLVAFGEFGADDDDDQDHLHTYDPATDTWAAHEPAGGWTEDAWRHDVPLTVLADGRVLIATGQAASSFETHKRCSIFDPADDSITETDAPTYSMLESGITLRQDGTVLHYQGTQVGSSLGAELYDPTTETWTPTSFPPNVQRLYDAVNYPVVDMGKLLLLTNGDVIQLGNEDGKTAVFAAATDTWALGPTMPTVAAQAGPGSAMDQPAVVMANGNVLAAIGYWTPGAIWNGPCRWVEFDGTTWDELDNQPAAGTSSYPDHAIPLPTGQVLVTTSSTRLWIFTPGSVTPPAGCAPVVSAIVDAGGSAAATLGPGSTYTVRGTRLNGVLLGCGNKDENSTNTNVPLVRLEYGDGTRVYCPVSSPRLQADDSPYMGVDPTALTEADFTVPETAPNGACTLVVVASGMPSAGNAVSINGAGQTWHEPLTVTGGLGEAWEDTGDWWYDGRLTEWFIVPTSPTSDTLGRSEWRTPSIVAAGGTAPYSYTLHGAQALPAGVTFNQDATGAWLTGTPTAPPYPDADPGASVVWNFEAITVVATDAFGRTGEGHFLLSVDEHAPMAWIDDTLGALDNVDAQTPNHPRPSSTAHLTDTVSRTHGHDVLVGRKYSRLVDG